MTDIYHTIGEAAARSGMSTRTLRFYSDTGLLPPRARTQAGYRMYTVEDISRLELIATLRKAGASLKAIKAVLQQRQSLKQVLEMRLAVLEQNLRTQTRLAAVLRLAVKNENPSADDLRRLEKMTEMSRSDRMATVNAFMDEVTDSIERSEQWTGRMVDVMVPGLPENPSRDQVDAWLDICRLFEDRSFKLAIRAQAVDTSRTGPNLRVYDSLDEWRARQNELLAASAEALKGGALPNSSVAARLADQYIAFMAWNRDVEDSAAFREQLWEMWAHIHQIGEFWTLVSILNGDQPYENQAYAWLEEATLERLSRHAAVTGKSDIL